MGESKSAKDTPSIYITASINRTGRGLKDVKRIKTSQRVVYVGSVEAEMGINSEEMCWKGKEGNLGSVVISVKRRIYRG